MPAATHGDCLIGHTGFVGRNLAGARTFATTVNSRTIHEVAGRSFGLVVCAAPHAKKWWANQNPERDRALIDTLKDSLSRMEADHFVLLSTIDVFPRTHDIDDGFEGPWEPNHAYGLNRRSLEEFVTAHFPASTIVRLPGLFGSGLEKNVFFDLKNARLLDTIQPASRFQWYDVGELGADLARIVEAEVGLIVLATEPVATGDIVECFFPHLSVGANAGASVAYDVRTLHDSLFGRDDGYVRGRDDVLASMRRFLERDG